MTVLARLSPRLRGLAGAEDRIAYVQTLRGLACIALVTFHVVGNDPRGGMRLPEGHPLVFLMNMLADFRMPLFSFISGFVFWPVVASLPELWRRVRGKARRLLLPMVFVGSLFWATQAGMGIAVPDYPMIFIEPFAHFWFLPATFLLMTAFYLGTWLAGGRHVPVAIGLGLAGAALWTFTAGWSPNLFSSYSAMFLAPFFMAGHLCAHWPPMVGRLDRLAAHARLVPAAILLGLALLALEVWLTSGGVGQGTPARKAISFAAGMTGCLALFILRPGSRLLGLVGAYSYGIFLFHVFFTAGARIGLGLLWPGAPDVVVLVFGLCAGLIGPILVTEAVLRVPAAALLLLGIAPRRRRAPLAPQPTPAT